MHGVEFLGNELIRASLDKTLAEQEWPFNIADACRYLIYNIITNTQFLNVESAALGFRAIG